VGGVGVWPTPADFEGGGRTNIEGVDRGGCGVEVGGRSAERMVRIEELEEARVDKWTDGSRVDEWRVERRQRRGLRHSI